MVLLAIASIVGALNVAVLLGGRARVVTAPIDCALVLGAGVGEDGSPSLVLHDRLTTALALYESGRVKTILVSGDSSSRSHDEPNTMRAWLEAHGIPSGAISMDHAGIDTYSSVWRARYVYGASRLIVVTQRFHLPRALWVARAIGMEAEGVDADRRIYSYATWFELREIGSRTKAFLDVLRKRTPRHTTR